MLTAAKFAVWINQYIQDTPPQATIQEGAPQDTTSQMTPPQATPVTPQQVTQNIRKNSITVHEATGVQI